MIFPAAVILSEAKDLLFAVLLLPSQEKADPSVASLPQDDIWSPNRLLRPDLGLREPTDEEVAEIGVLRARLVEAHLRYEFLEVDGVFGEERHAPFPLIEPDRARNNLCNSAGVAPARETVTVHQLAPLHE